jgi:hypothetical protein
MRHILAECRDTRDAIERKMFHHEQHGHSWLRAFSQMVNKMRGKPHGQKRLCRQNRSA